MKKNLAVFGRAGILTVLGVMRPPLTTTTMLPFPADSEEYEEYVSVMESMADESDRLPDPEPPDDSHLDGDLADDDPSDYDDGYSGDPYGRDDDYSEYGQEGCCGDF